MRVRKCDGCGRIYEEPWTHESMITAGELVVIRPYVDGCNDEAINRREDRDLCPGCLKRVLEFIDVLKETHKTGETYCIHICPKEEETK